MKKIKRTHLIGFTIAVLFLGLTSSILGQSYQGCVSSEKQSRFAFQFAPNKVIVEPDGKIVLTIFNEEGKFEVKDEKIFKIDHPDKSQDPNNANSYRAATYNNEYSLRNVTIPTDNLYALVEDGSNFEIETQGKDSKGRKYVFPVDKPADGAEIDGKKVKILTFNSNRELIFDTEGMPEGYHWVTLQGNVTFAGETPCAKTTPPVLIEIRKVYPTPTSTPTPTPPTVKLSVEGSRCELRTLTAVAEDKDNEPNSGLPPQTLILNWALMDDKGNKYDFQKTPIGNPTDARYIEQANSINLKPGNYNVKVTVSDGKYTATDYRNFVVQCAGAGIVYFQFDEPYKPKNGIFNVKKYDEPDSWIVFFKRKSQCRNEVGLYPSSEFSLFYTMLQLPIPPIDENTRQTVSNKDKLIQIANTLKDNPNLRLYVAGYADFKASDSHNYPLAGRRIEVVKRYLERLGVEKDRLDGAVVRNLSDSKAQSCYQDACLDSRRHDRRVELYFYTVEKPTPPDYPNSSCPVNANLIINSLYENDLEILADK